MILSVTMIYDCTVNSINSIKANVMEYPNFGAWPSGTWASEMQRIITYTKIERGLSSTGMHYNYYRGLNSPYGYGNNYHYPPLGHGIDDLVVKDSYKNSVSACVFIGSSCSFALLYYCYTH